jgi:hypothetical protein
LDNTKIPPTRLKSDDFQSYLDQYGFKSVSQQNQVINSIRFLYKEVLGKKYDKVYFKRPRKEKKLPKVIGEDGMYYAKYLIDERALQLHKEVFDMLENFLGEDLMTYVIEWFNEEFGTNAESVSFMFRLPNF